MKLGALFAVVAVMALVTATPALAGDVSADRYWKKQPRAPAAAIASSGATSATAPSTETKAGQGMACACHAGAAHHHASAL